MIESLKMELRELGHKLAVREMYGDNTPKYHDERRRHYKLLLKLYELEKRSL
jgi:hypothetical protein